jgi:serine/threonine protein kinase
MFLNLTGDTGSPRYMDPEVAMLKPYNELCDVYSFCILLWEMIELATPFQGYTVSMFTKKVVQGGVRPKINTDLPVPIQRLFENGFGSIYQRQSMADVCSILCSEVSSNCHREENKNKNRGSHCDSLSSISSRKSDRSIRNLMLACEF